MDVFSIMPVEAFLDDRMTKTDLRVLGAIMSFRNKNTNLCWPSRERIADRCGLPLCKISTATTHLVGLGWLKKEGNGGRSRSVNYEVIVPNILGEKVTDSVRVSDAEKVTDSVTVTNSVTVTESVTQTVTDSVRGIEQTNEQTIINNKAKAEKDVSKNSGKKKICISENWQPSDRCFELITRAGISRDFASGLVDEFVLYWSDRGDKRVSWDTTFLNNVKLQFSKRKSKPLASARPAVVRGGSSDAENEEFNKKYGHLRGLSYA